MPSWPPCSTSRPQAPSWQAPQMQWCAAAAARLLVLHACCIKCVFGVRSAEPAALDPCRQVPAHVCVPLRLPCLQLSEMKALIGYFDLDPNRCFRWVGRGCRQQAHCGNRPTQCKQGHALCSFLGCCPTALSNSCPSLAPPSPSHLVQHCSGCLLPAAQQ